MLLDVLHAHTTDYGAAKTLTTLEYEKLYQHIDYRLELLSALKNRYLIIEPQTNLRHEDTPRNRLVHDTLAQLIKSYYTHSELPGQRFRRILSNRYNEWIHQEEKQSLLDQHELSLYQAGKIGTRHINKIEKKNIKDSQKSYRKNELMQEVITNILFITLVAMTFLFLNGTGATLL